MTTVSTKHSPAPQGDPPLSVLAAKGTIIDDMELIRKYCLPQKLNLAHRNASNISFGKAPDGPLQTTKQSDFGQPSMADVEPKGTRDKRSRYMNTKHFDLGNDAPPMLTQAQASYTAPPRNFLVSRPRDHMIGGSNSTNASNMFVSDKDREDWVNDLKSSNQDNFRTPAGDVRDPNTEAIAKNLRAHHFDFGSEPIDYTSHSAASFPTPTTPPQRVEPVKAPPSAVQLGSADYPWGKDLQTTHKEAFTKHDVGDDDSLTQFVKQGPPLSFGEDKREMMTTYKTSYKQIGYLDCSNLTDEQLLMLGVTREQIIPRKIPLPYLSHQAFKNSLSQPITS